MLNLLKRFFLAGLLAASSPIHGFASPAQSKLLALIPREAQVVGGVEDPRNPDPRGHLLLVTPKNRFDLDDWLSLTGVDTTRSVDETIWVAASSPHGQLNEHMLLVAGQFDGEHIVQAAKQNGISTSLYRGLKVMLVNPLPRETAEMSDVRWLAFLDDRAAVFGTPWLVQRALDRYADHMPADGLVADRMGRLDPRVNSWDLILTPYAASSRHVAPWIDLLGRSRLEKAQELILGIRYGATARVDFIIRTAGAGNPSAAMAPGPMLDRAAFPGGEPRMESLSSAPNLTIGTLVLPGKKLYACFELASCGEPAESLHAAK